MILAGKLLTGSIGVIMFFWLIYDIIARFEFNAFDKFAAFVVAAVLYNLLNKDSPMGGSDGKDS
jgi:uncharacterized membrane protein